MRHTGGYGNGNAKLRSSLSRSLLTLTWRARVSCNSCLTKRRESSRSLKAYNKAGRVTMLCPGCLLPSRLLFSLPTYLLEYCPCLDKFCEWTGRQIEKATRLHLSAISNSVNIRDRPALPKAKLSSWTTSIRERSSRPPHCFTVAKPRSDPDLALRHRPTCPPVQIVFSLNADFLPGHFLPWVCKFRHSRNQFGGGSRPG